METAVGREQAESYPAFVHIRRGSMLKPADVMRPVTESGHHQREAAAQAFFHGFIVGPAVSSPVDREFLAAYRGRAGEQYGFPFAALPFQQFIDAFIVQVGIIVVHFLRVGAVVIDDVFGRNPFAEIRLETVHAHIQQCFQFILEPAAGFRIGEIHDSHAGLPHIPLPYLAVGTPDEVPFFGSFVKEGGFLCNVGVNPYADVQPFGLDAPQHA